MSNNTTEGLNTDLVFPVWKTSVIATFIAIMILLTVGGNLIVISAFLYDKSLRSFTDYFILNLAIADMLIGAVCVPLYAPYLLMGTWPMGVIICRIWLVLDYVTPASSALCMCVITLDRYLQLTKPLEYRAKQNKKLRNFMMVIPWLLAMVTYIPGIALWEVWTGTNPVAAGDCHVPFHANIAYLLFGAFVEFIIPFLFVSTFNFLVFLSIRKRTKHMVAKRRMQIATASTYVRNDPTSTVSQDKTSKGGSRSLSQSQQQVEKMAKDRKAARSLFILVIVFGICWMPYEVAVLIQAVCNDCVDAILSETFFWMFWLNSTINPFLYPLLHTRYKKAFKNLFKGINRIFPVGS